LFLYRLPTYHLKGFKESYNFVVGSMVAPRGSAFRLLPKGIALAGNMIALLGEHGYSPREYVAPLGSNHV
jgi:hypothetical protein